MAQILLTKSAPPATPPSGQANIYINTSGTPRTINDNGVDSAFGISDAPFTSGTYGRNNGGWVVVSGTGGGSGGFSTKIALASPASNIDFTSIVQTSSCLELRYYLRSTRVSEVDNVYVRLNNDSSNLYDFAQWYAFNSAPYGWYQSAAQSLFWGPGMPAASATAGYFSSGIIWINNYSGSVGWKMVHVRSVYQSNTTGDGWGIYDTFGTYKSTSPITRVTLLPATGPNFDTGSMAVLLGSG